MSHPPQHALSRPPLVLNHRPRHRHAFPANPVATHPCGGGHAPPATHVTGLVANSVATKPFGGGHTSHAPQGTANAFAANPDAYHFGGRQTFNVPTPTSHTRPPNTPDAPTFGGSNNYFNSFDRTPPSTGSTSSDSSDTPETNCTTPTQLDDVSQSLDLADGTDGTTSTDAADGPPPDRQRPNTGNGEPAIADPPPRKKLDRTNLRRACKIKHANTAGTTHINRSKTL